MIWLILYILGYFVSWWYIAGMLLSAQQFPIVEGDFALRLAERNFRGDLGFSVLLATLYSTAWPIALPAVFCLTGFAEHGVWRTPRRSGPVVDIESARESRIVKRGQR